MVCTRYCRIYLTNQNTNELGCRFLLQIQVLICRDSSQLNKMIRRTKRMDFNLPDNTLLIPFRHDTIRLYHKGWQLVNTPFAHYLPGLQGRDYRTLNLILQSSPMPFFLPTHAVTFAIREFNKVVLVSALTKIDEFDASFGNVVVIETSQLMWTIPDGYWKFTSLLF